MSRGNAAAPRRGRGSRGSGWVNDLAIGLRLALLAGRSPKSIVVRLTLATIGIGLLVAVLLLGSALMPAMDARADRVNAQEPITNGEQGQPSVTTAKDSVQYHGEMIPAIYLDPSGPNAPVPPGLQRIPAPGEAVVSPALAELLHSKQGTLLRPRIGEEVVGQIDRSGVGGPAELRFYVGADLSSVESAQVAYGFGGPNVRAAVSAEQLLFVIPATAILLVPLLIFISTTSRVSGAERERKLSALRLAGGSKNQVRRIAATEPLVGLLTGGVLGVGLFLLVRQFVAEFSFAGRSFYPSDLDPPWWMVVLIAVLVPALTIGASWIGMRGTIVEPLGVVRSAKVVRRKGWWRLALVAVGVVLMQPQLLGLGTMNPNAAMSMGVGAALLVIGVPVLMPWVTERAVSRLNGPTTSWQLAVRRLQMDSGTPTRVIAGVVVVLAGAIALHTMFGAVQRDISSTTGSGHSALISVSDSSKLETAQVKERVAAAPGVRTAHTVRSMSLHDDAGHYVSIVIASCGYLDSVYGVADCANGDAFTERSTQLREGSELTDYDYSTGTPVAGDTFTLGAVRPVAEFDEVAPRQRADVLSTPAAAKAMSLPTGRQYLIAALDAGGNDTLERIRNELAGLHWDTRVVATGDVGGGGVQALSKIKSLVYLGAELVMLLAGVSLLVAATQQVADRRKAFAAMSASGVPTATLARSLLWQNAIPICFGVVVATGIGLGVSASIMRPMEDMPFNPDWGFIAGLTGSAVALVLAVTAGTLPALRSATKLDALRTE